MTAAEEKELQDLRECLRRAHQQFEDALAPPHNPPPFLALLHPPPPPAAWGPAAAAPPPPPPPPMIPANPHGMQAGFVPPAPPAGYQQHMTALQRQPWQQAAPSEAWGARPQPPPPAPAHLHAPPGVTGGYHPGAQRLPSINDPLPRPALPLRCASCVLGPAVAPARAPPCRRCSARTWRPWH